MDVVLIGKNKEEHKDMMKVVVKEIKESSFGKIEDFKYFEGLLKERIIMEKEILIRIQAGNRCSFSMGKMFKSKLLSRT
ncbi:hypothetical protein PR048_013357 [Dryococelus australis]|uniref:Uncharacterized protein n=1 Tax=Dryococelus australis TaxID=614101 RepID=A0ABQ9HS04_9NEOP|nr:hypothetical protein PR048_013357 [Dryococelus australis]